MSKKILLVLILTVAISVSVAFGTVYVVLKKIDEGEKEPEIVDVIDLNKIDYEQLQSYALEKMTIKLADAKPNYLVIEAGIYVTDEEMLTRVQALNSKIKDVVLGVFESRTASELEGNREVMKQVMLDSIREIFVKQSDKEKIVDISITNYMIAQQ